MSSERRYANELTAAQGYEQLKHRVGRNRIGSQLPQFPAPSNNPC